jgi:hypothetical protein
MTKKKDVRENVTEKLIQTTISIILAVSFLSFIYGTGQGMAILDLFKL